METAMVARVSARTGLWRILQNCVHCFSTVSRSIDPFHPKLSQQSLYRKEISLANLFQRVFEDFPTVVVMDKEEILSIIEFLMEIGVPRDKIDRVISLHPRVLGLGIEDRLKPLLCDLSDLGFSDDEIIKEIIREPKILGMELGEFSRRLQLLKTLKCREPIKEKIFQEGILRAGFEVKLRVDCLCSHGLIRRDAFKVLWEEPRVVTYDLENYEKKIDFLAQDGI
ncbi:hypothetical protein K1719_011368 [Acacia pycnantha]|nr:hypothetical protein K1719_011368 [Acacia pycnantha]